MRAPCTIRRAPVVAQVGQPDREGRDHAAEKRKHEQDERPVAILPRAHRVNGEEDRQQEMRDQPEDRHERSALENGGRLRAAAAMRNRRIRRP